MHFISLILFIFKHVAETLSCPSKSSWNTALWHLLGSLAASCSHVTEFWPERWWEVKGAISRPRPRGGQHTCVVLSIPPPPVGCRWRWDPREAESQGTEWGSMKQYRGALPAHQLPGTVLGARNELPSWLSPHAFWGLPVTTAKPTLTDQAFPPPSTKEETEDPRRKELTWQWLLGSDTESTSNKGKNRSGITPN